MLQQMGAAMGPAVRVALYEGVAEERGIALSAISTCPPTPEGDRLLPRALANPVRKARKAKDNSGC